MIIGTARLPITGAPLTSLTTRMKGLNTVAYWLVIIGALNWGLVGIGAFLGSNWNVVNLIFGFSSALEWLIYILVGLSALVLLFGKKSSAPMPMGM